jgi:hypothetical protein
MLLGASRLMVVGDLRSGFSAVPPSQILHLRCGTSDSMGWLSNRK